MSLGDAASVATLVLFIFYFIGRIWTIRKNTQLMLEDFSLEDASDCVDFADSREIFYHLENSEYGEIISMRYKQPLLWLHIIPITYDGDARKTVRRKAVPIISHDKLIPENKPIYIRTDLPEGFPRYMVRFRRFDYFEGSFELSYDGSFGGMHPAEYHLHPTFKGFLYYFVR